MMDESNKIFYKELKKEKELIEKIEKEIRVNLLHSCMDYEDRWYCALEVLKLIRDYDNEH